MKLDGDGLSDAPYTTKSKAQRSIVVLEDVYPTVPLLPVESRWAKSRRQSHAEEASLIVLVRRGGRLRIVKMSKRNLRIIFEHEVRE